MNHDAIEAAAKAMDRANDEWPHPYRVAARAALEAALPYLLGEAIEEFERRALEAGNREARTPLSHDRSRAAGSQRAYSAAANYLRKELGGGSATDDPSSDCHGVSRAEEGQASRPVGGTSTSSEQGKCICADEGLGFDSLDPLAARPCPVHSPEYADVIRGAVGDDRAPADRRMLERLYVLICGGSEKDWEQRCTEAALILAEALQGQVVESKSASVPTVLSVPASEPGASGDPGVGTAGAERVESPSYERPGASGDNPALGSDRAPGACECCGKPVAACLCSDCRAADDRASEWPEEIRLIRIWDFGTALNYAVEPKGSPPPTEEHRYYVPRSHLVAVLEELARWAEHEKAEYDGVRRSSKYPPSQRIEAEKLGRAYGRVALRIRTTIEEVEGK